MQSTSSEHLVRQVMVALARWNKVKKRAVHIRHRKAGGGRRASFYKSVWEKEAAAIGASISFLEGTMADIRRGDSILRVSSNVTSVDDPVTRSVAGDKPLVLRLLSERGIPTPPYLACSREDVASARRFMRTLRRPCVVKPARSTGAGQGITTGVDTVLRLIAAMGRAGSYCEDLILEEQVEGGVYRLLYLDGELLDAVERRPPRVRGDGARTVKELIGADNRDRIKGGIEVSQTLIAVDRELKQTLRAAGLRLDSVPPEGSVVRLKNVVNDNRREDNVAANDRICAAVAESGAAAAAAVGVRLAGVDVITPDSSLPLEKAGGVIIEVNTSPGFYYHYLRAGEPCPVARLILERLFGGVR